MGAHLLVDVYSEQCVIFIGITPVYGYIIYITDAPSQQPPKI